MKRQTLSGMLLLLALAAQGATVTPEEAIGRVRQFSSRQGATMRRTAPTGQLTLAYTSTSPAGDCFYIFNSPQGGFTIASADDRLPSVLGFSSEGSFDIDKAPENVRWWLEQYRRQIEAFLKADPRDAPVYVERARPADYPAIAPLTTTKWDQGRPYNNDCPYDSWGKGTSVTGCVATAMAQVMKYHNWPEHPHGMRGGYNFNNTTLRWDLMIDDYSGQYTSAQAEAVALLMRQCGASVDMQYSAYESGAYSCDVQVALRTYFDYDPYLEMHFRDYYTYSEWNKLVYNELATNGPVYYSGRSDRGGHAFVCDGYLGNNYYHFNWGWGGYQDGYFLLNALNPATGGTGSYAGGYNSDQSILTGLKPLEGAAPSNPQVQKLALTTGGFGYRNGEFVIQEDPDGYNLVYNPLGDPLTATFGVKIEKADGTGTPTYVSSGGNQTFSTGYGFNKMKVSLPTNLSDGTYKVTPAMRVQGRSEWQPVLVPLQFQTYVELNVAGGKHTLTNPGVQTSVFRLFSSLPESLTVTKANTGQAMRVTVTNVGDGDFMGTIYLTVMDHDDPFGQTYSAEKWVMVPSQFSLDIDFSSDYQLCEGNYDIYIMEENGSDLIESRSLTVEPSTLPVFSAGALPLYVQDFQPRFYTVAPEGCGVSLKAYNTTKSDIDLNLTLEVISAADMSVKRTLHAEGIKVEKEKASFVNFANIDLEAAPGEYYWRVKDTSTGEDLCPLVPLLIHSETRHYDGLDYIVTSENPACATVIPGMKGEYEGDIVIPDVIEGNTVTAIKGNTFTFADALTSLRLPSAINYIDEGAFYFATSLRHLRMGAKEPPMVSPNAFGPGLEENIMVSMPKGSANLYAATDSWANFMLSNWSLEPGAGITLSDLSIDPRTGKIYAPYYVGADEALVFKAAAPAGKNVKAEWKLSDSTSGSAVFNGEIWLPVLMGKTGNVTLTATTEPVSSVGELETADTVSYPVNVYSIDGRLVMQAGGAADLEQLAPGVYLIGTRKIVRR